MVAHHGAVLAQAGVGIIEVALVEDGAAIGPNHHGLGRDAGVQLPGELVAGIDL